MLVREGLARVDDYNTTAVLKEAEEAAKREKKNVSGIQHLEIGAHFFRRFGGITMKQLMK